MLQRKYLYKQLKNSKNKNIILSTFGPYTLPKVIEMAVITKIKWKNNHDIIRIVKNKYLLVFKRGKCYNSWVIKGYTNQTTYRVSNS